MRTDPAEVLARLDFPLGITRGPQHVVELLNAAAREVLGAGEVLGRPIREGLSEAAGQGLVALLDEVYRTGRPYQDPAQRVVLRRAGEDVECWFSVRHRPLRGPDGEVLGLILQAFEVTELHRAHRHDLRLAEAARARSAALQELAEALSSAATPAAIGELAATRAADLLGADAANVFVTADGGLEQVHFRGWTQELTAPYRRLALQRGRPLSDAVLTGVPVWLESAEQWRARYPEMAPVHGAGGYEASACLPMRVEDREQGEVRDLGGLVFSFRAPRQFSVDEREYLVTIASLCAQSLDRARLYVAEQQARSVAERERDRTAFLAEAGLLLDAPMSVEARLQRLADLAVPGIADWCAVSLVRGARVDQVAVGHSDPQKVEFVRRLQERYPPDPHTPGGSIQVARTGVPSFVPEISQELVAAAARDAEHLELIRSIGLRSIVTVPLQVRGRSLGSLSLVQAESGRRFDEADLSFAGELAARAALALDNARLYEQQRSIAHALQSALVPAALPEIPGVRLAARYLAQAEGTEVGGDTYDVYPGATPGQWAFMIGDVCGKGALAAALTALIRYSLRAECGHGLAPAEALRRLNAAMLGNALPGDLRFATVVHGTLRVDAQGADVTAVNAGHPSPLLLRKGAVEPVLPAGTLLGVYPDPRLVEGDVRLRPGETMVCYTDGVTEARGADGGLYGSSRLSALLSDSAGCSAEEIAETVVADVVAFQNGSLRDDVAVLVMQVPADRATE
jgi:serine phosphatase RsbU (regulator of sigma subunit)